MGCRKHPFARAGEKSRGSAAECDGHSSSSGTCLRLLEPLEHPLVVGLGRARYPSNNSTTHSAGLSFPADKKTSDPQNEEKGVASSLCSRRAAAASQIDTVAEKEDVALSSSPADTTSTVDDEVDDSASCFCSELTRNGAGHEESVDMQDRCSKGTQVNATSRFEVDLDESRQQKKTNVQERGGESTRQRQCRTRTRRLREGGAVGVVHAPLSSKARSTNSAAPSGAASVEAIAPTATPLGGGGSTIQMDHDAEAEKEQTKSSHAGLSAGASSVSEERPPADQEGTSRSVKKNIDDYHNAPKTAAVQERPKSPKMKFGLACRGLEILANQTAPKTPEAPESPTSSTQLRNSPRRGIQSATCSYLSRKPNEWHDSAAEELGRRLAGTAGVESQGLDMANRWNKVTFNMDEPRSSEGDERGSPKVQELNQEAPRSTDIGVGSASSSIATTPGPMGTSFTSNGKRRRAANQAQPATPAQKRQRALLPSKTKQPLPGGVSPAPADGLTPYLGSADSSGFNPQNSFPCYYWPSPVDVAFRPAPVNGLSPHVFTPVTTNGAVSSGFNYQSIISFCHWPSPAALALGPAPMTYPPPGDFRPAPTNGSVTFCSNSQSDVLCEHWPSPEAPRGTASFGTMIPSFSPGASTAKPPGGIQHHLSAGHRKTDGKATPRISLKAQAAPISSSALCSGQTSPLEGGPSDATCSAYLNKAMRPSGRGGVARADVAASIITGAMGHPRTPFSAYGNFARRHRFKLKTQNPNATKDEITHMLRTKWEELDELTRKAYDDDYAERKLQYQYEIAKCGLPETPRKPEVAWMCYSHEHRAEVVGNHPNATRAEIGRILMKQWHELDSPTRKVYEDDYKKRVKQFHHETAVWQIFSGRPPVPPVCPRSPYNTFANEQRMHLRRKYPTATREDISKMLKKQWGQIPESSKKEYEDKFAAKADQFKVGAWGLPAYPKRPLSCFNLYANENRARVIKRYKLTGLSSKDVQKFLGKLWNELDESTRKKYKDAHAKTHKEFKRMVNEWNDRASKNLQIQQFRLCELRHSFKCPHRDGCCPVSVHCARKKRLLRHMTACENDKCAMLNCRSHRELLNHHYTCKDASCPVCAPARILDG